MTNSKPKYLDNAASTPLDPRVFEAMKPYFLEHFGNASSKHVYGVTAKKAIETARDQVAEIINAEAKEMIFTSGSTEAINLVIKGYLEANPDKGNHIITVKTEHKAVLNTCEYLETKGVEVTYLGVDSNGIISLDELQNAIQENTSLICVMYVNNEIGVIQPIQEIGQIARNNDICFFSDATQAVGKVKVDVIADNIDMLCLSGHKMNGPKGVGALYIRNGIKLEAQIHGGGQERGMRGGTYNTPLIVGLGIACELARIEFDKNVERLRSERDEHEERFKKDRIGEVNCKDALRAPHISSLSLIETDAEDFLLKKHKEFVASTGSACNSGIVDCSHVSKEINSQNCNKILRLSFHI